jgi:hypothetical protein
VPRRICTPEKRAALVAYAQSGTVTEAARAAGVCRTTWYNWREADPDFDEAAIAAEAAVADYLERIALHRATRAENASDTLLIFLLKGMRPAKFRDRHQIEHTGANGGPIQHEDVTAARDRVRHRLAHLLGTN